MDFCGDANEVPGDSIIEETMNNYGGSLIGTSQGTRWDSDREIDWFVVSCQQKIVQPPVALQQILRSYPPSNPHQVLRQGFASSHPGDGSLLEPPSRSRSRPMERGCPKCVGQ